jgi:hypothetical protein
MNHLIRNLSVILIAGLFAISCASTEPTSSVSGSDSPRTDRSDSNGYSSVITSEAETQQGVVDIHSVGDKIYYEFRTPFWAVIF